MNGICLDVEDNSPRFYIIIHQQPLISSYVKYPLPIDEMACMYSIKSCVRLVTDSIAIMFVGVLVVIQLEAAGFNIIMQSAGSHIFF
jgi:hypothetical protein